MTNPLTPGAVRSPGAPLTLMTIGTPRAIENPAFPFDKFCEVAELESWRKEIARPVYHVHKWWAQRLGSVFRAILIGTLSDFNADVSHLFYQPVRFPDATIFDPFMGSGTTVGEAAKLGARAIGRDINPVACFAARRCPGPGANAIDRARVRSGSELRPSGPRREQPGRICL